MNDPKEKQYDDTTDSFSPEEQKKIVDMVCSDIDSDTEVQGKWTENVLKKALNHKHAEKPSRLEGITKKGWQSDRNLGIAPAIADSYHATLMATCWNPDSIHAIATEENDLDNKDALERFTKWMVSRNELNAYNEAYDYIRNKVDQGFAVFEIYRSVWYEWIDRDIPIFDKQTGKVTGYKTKTEKKRFEKAVMENIDNLDDILMPRYGDDIQKLPHIIRIIHLTGDNLLDYGKSGKFININAKSVLAMKNAAHDIKDDIENLKGEHLSLEDVVDGEFRALPIDVYKWYGYYTKNGKREKYRFYVEYNTRTLLAGKPLRKIRKDGKYPFVGGPFDRIVGQIRGNPLFILIEDPINALNETWNQKADFQYVTNCPFGFHKSGEGYTQNAYDLEPGVSYPTEGNPSEEHYFPNIQRSMSWAESDFRILFEVIEKRTGAANYFASNYRNQSGTATRDAIVQQNSETRFGVYVNTTQDEICEAITMALNIYQEHIPDNLGERVLGEDGKRLFPGNFSVETIRYRADVRMAPDMIAGSKAYEKQVYTLAYQTAQSSIWFSPQMNPRGNWRLTRDFLKKQGFAAPEMYLPPEPKPELGTGKEVDMIWQRLRNGEVIEIEKTWNIPEVLAGLYKKKADDYSNLDEEYRPNLDQLIFDLEIGYAEFVKTVQEEQMASQMAQRAIMAGPGMGGSQSAPGAGPAPAPGPAPMATPEEGQVSPGMGI